jgi:ABC-2 type transport system permease protein
MAATITIFKKELADLFVNKRFLVLFAVILLLSTASAYQGANYLKSSSSSTGAGFLSIFSEGSNGSSFVSLMVEFGPLLGLALSFDAINKERKSGSLSTMLAQPIFRDSIINGKFLAGATGLALAIVVTLGINMGIAIPLLGFGPTSTQALAIVTLALVTIVYLCFWYALGLFFSVLCKETSTSILASVATWITFSILIFIFANFVANVSVSAVSFNPGGNFENITTGFGNFTSGNFSRIFNVSSTVTTSRTAISDSISQISPAYLYSDIASRLTGAASSSFTGFSVSIPRFTGVQYSLGSALAASWGEIVIIALAMVIFFVASYMLFLRSEIRPQG